MASPETQYILPLVFALFHNHILLERFENARGVRDDTLRPSVLANIGNFRPEKLLRALLLQALYSICSERMLVEQIEYNLLFCRTIP